MSSVKTQVGLSEDNLCPFCSENPGTRSRAFAMHVGRHMEEVALAILPRDSEFEDDQGSAGSSIDSSSLEDKPDYLTAGAVPFIIDGLEESNLSDYDAQMFCALGLYVMDSAGQAKCVSSSRQQEHEFYVHYHSCSMSCLNARLFLRPEASILFVSCLGTGPPPHVSSGRSRLNFEELRDRFGVTVFL